MIPDENLSKAPFPWFGGKRRVAPVVWAALGDVPHYVEPFFGSGAVLLERPHLANRPYLSETVNDVDAWIVNFWRALQADPEGVAREASWPVSEVDLHARHLWLLDWRARNEPDYLMAQPERYDVRAAGWWAWGVSCSISGIGNHGGPWIARQEPGDERGPKMHKQPKPRRNETREPGTKREIPHLGNNGQGVVRPQLREPGLGEPHPWTMPELVRWLGFLSARLRHVRVICGDWARALGSGASLTLPVRQGHGPCGVFLDPPYDSSAAANGASATIYGGRDTDGISAAVRAWCHEHGQDSRYRIVLAGYAGEGHESLEADGWRCVDAAPTGFLAGGYSKDSAKKERLWLSPHCLSTDAPIMAERQGTLF